MGVAKPLPTRPPDPWAAPVWAAIQAARKVEVGLRPSSPWDAPVPVEEQSPAGRTARAFGACLRIAIDAAGAAMPDQPEIIEGLTTAMLDWLRDYQHSMPSQGNAR